LVKLFFFFGLPSPPGLQPIQSLTCGVYFTENQSKHSPMVFWEGYILIVINEVALL